MYPCHSDYPEQLEPIRARVLDTLTGQPFEQKKLQTCRYKSRCHSIYCPLCCRQEGYGRKDRIMRAASQVNGTRLRFGTFKIKDVALDAIAEAGRQIMQAGRKAFKALNVTGYAARVETSFEDWSDTYHPHLHVLLDTPSGGRGFIPADKWQRTWLNELPASLQPFGEATHVEPVRDLEAVCTYLTKAPFFRHVADNATAISRIVHVLGESRGMQKFLTRGSLATILATAHCAPVTS